MHPSFIRLLDCAKQATAKWPLGERIENESDLKAALDVTASTFSNWKSRGVSVDGALRAEELYGIPASWLRSAAVVTEESPSSWMSPQHSSQGPAHVGFTRSQPVRLIEEDSVLLVTWEVLMQAKDLPKRFRVELRDDSLSPDLNAGDLLEMHTEIEPRAGDIVLVRDEQSNLFVRYLREGLPGKRMLHSPNQAFSPIALDTQRLALVAVAVSETRRRRREP